MGKRVTYISDLSGVEVDGLEEITFTVNGERGKLEVSPSERAEFLDAMAPYLDAVRAIKGEASANPTHVTDDAKTMRISLDAWGYKGVPAKGRLAPEWVEKYNAEKSKRNGAVETVDA